MNLTTYLEHRMEKPYYLQVAESILYTEDKAMRRGQYENYWIEKKMELLSSELDEHSRRVSQVCKSILSMQDNGSKPRDSKEQSPDL